MIKNLEKKVSQYHKKFDKVSGYAVPNETVFRLLGHSNFNSKNKKILDIGIGYGDNLLEFCRRGGITFGIDIREKILNSFIKKNKQEPKNYFHCDLNQDFPKINEKMDLVLCKDTICYIKPERQFILFDEINKILKKNGFILFQYIQAQLKSTSKNFFSFNLGTKSSFHNMKHYMDKENPLPFLKNQHIKKLVNNKNFKIKKNIFDLNIHTKDNKTIYTINRFILLQKK